MIEALTRILHECNVWIENYFLRITVWQYAALQGFAECCKTVILRDRILYLHQTLMFDFFFKRNLKVSFSNMNKDIGIGHFEI